MLNKSCMNTTNSGVGGSGPHSMAENPKNYIMLVMYDHFHYLIGNHKIIGSIWTQSIM
jgi:hypothetical protein